MPRERRDVAAALRRKGFREESSNRDHDYFIFEAESLIQPVYTKLSRGTSYREIDDSLLAKIRRQLQLDKKDFNDFIECPLEQHGYEQILKRKGILAAT